MTKNEPWDDPRVTAYVMNELGGEDKAAFEKEVSQNSDLAAAVDEARAVTAKLESLFAAESTPALDESRRVTITSGASGGNAGKLRIAMGVLVTIAACGLVAFLVIPATNAVRESARRPVAMTTTDEMVRIETSVEEEEQAQIEFVPETGMMVEKKTRDVSPTPVHSKSPTIDRSLANKAMPGKGFDHPYGGYGMGMDGAQPAQISSDDYGSDYGMVEMDGSMDFAFSGEPTIDKKALALNRQRRQRSQLLETRAGGAMLGVTPRIIIEEEDPAMVSRFGGGDRFDPITDNAFKRVSEHPLSTFSVDVDTASYSKVRDIILRANQLPRPDAVRIEEMMNYFDYDYAAPDNDAPHPFIADVDITGCPWNTDHRLARIAIQGKAMKTKERPKSNLVFLIDTSGSMNQPNKLPLVVEGMKMLTKQLGADDRVAIVVYAGSAGLVLDSTSAKKGKKIRKALTQLSAGGSTNGGAGVQLAYQTARENFIEGGVNRVILCSDGDFNVGTTGTDELVRMVERESKSGIFLTVLGFGMGNHNDAMMEQVSGRGNGNYAFIDTEAEAKKVLVDQISGTLVTIAKDVKLQVEFNPAKVSSYRLIGYENRILAKEDFNDDKKDAGEIGAGHSVTALYEIVPAGVEADASVPPVDDLKYQSKSETTAAADSDEMLTVKLRYKQPDGDTSTLVDFPVTDDGAAFNAADVDTKFAAAVAGFGMQLRRSEYAGSWTMTDVINVAKSAQGDDVLRAEFVTIAKKAADLMGAE